MDFETYTEEADKTLSHGLFFRYRPEELHAAIGIVTEVAELTAADNKVNLVEEIGDILWYVAILSKYAQLKGMQNYKSQKPLYSANHALMEVTQAAFEILDTYKKATFYNKEIYYSDIKSHVSSILTNISVICKENDTSIEDVMKINIAKLNERYSLGFSESEANYRDIGKENKLMGSMLNKSV